MTESDLSIIKFSFMSVWTILLNSKPFYPIQSLLIKLIHSLIEAEERPDKDLSDRVHWIYNNTHKDVMIPLCIVELAVYKNIDKGLQREITLYDKDYNLAYLYHILDEVTLEISRMSIIVAKKYAFEIPVNSFSAMNKGNNQTISIE